MENIKLIAVDIDGVLLEDTFSPVLRNLIIHLGGEYNSEVERHVFSRPQLEAASYVKRALNIEKSDEEIINMFFMFRDDYMKTHEKGLIDGAADLLKMLSSINIKIVCYGGLSESQIVEEFNDYLPYFDQYICTNDFRPGLREITKDYFGLEYSDVLFIDDVNSVAEEAKKLNAAFIGIPSSFEWGWQLKDMRKTNVKYILNSVKDIDIDLLEKIDMGIVNNTIWSRN